MLMQVGPYFMKTLYKFKGIAPECILGFDPVKQRVSRNTFSVQDICCEVPVVFFSLRSAFLA